MPQVKFVGHGASVVVPAVADKVFAQGEAVEVTDEEAEYLVAGGPFELAGAGETEEKEPEVDADAEADEDEDEPEADAEADDNEGDEV